MNDNQSQEIPIVQSPHAVGSFPTIIEPEDEELEKVLINGYMEE